MTYTTRAEMLAAIDKLTAGPKMRDRVADMKAAQDALKNMEPSEQRRFRNDLQAVVLRAVDAAVEKADA